MHCEICGCDIASGQAVGCRKCNAPFHRDCWDFNGRCGIYGCGSDDCEDYRPPEEGALVAIDEETRPPFRLEPHVESLVRKLPHWGRGSLFPVLLGMIGASLTYGLLMGSVSSIKPQAIALLYGSGVSIAVLANFLGSWLRRRPWLAFFATVVPFTLVGGMIKDMSGKSYLLLGVYCILGALASSGLVEGLAGRFRRSGLAGLACILLRSWLTALLFYGLMYVQSLVVACPFSFREMWVLPLLSFFVAAPPLEAGKSSLLNRLKAETNRRQIEG